MFCLLKASPIPAGVGIAAWFAMDVGEETPAMTGSRRRQLEITNELGLHLRAANRWVELARRFESDVRVFWNGRTADGKSILDLLTLGAEFGAMLEVEVSGPDSDEAAAALSDLA